MKGYSLEETCQIIKCNATLYATVSGLQTIHMMGLYKFLHIIDCSCQWLYHIGLAHIFRFNCIKYQLDYMTCSFSDSGNLLKSDLRENNFIIVAFFCNISNIYTVITDSFIITNGIKHCKDNISVIYSKSVSVNFNYVCRKGSLAFIYKIFVLIECIKCIAVEVC